MKIRVFRNVTRPGDWEINFIGKVWNLRIARTQFALWRNYREIFNLGPRVREGWVAASEPKP